MHKTFTDVLPWRWVVEKYKHPLENIKLKFELSWKWMQLLIIRVSQHTVLLWISSFRNTTLGTNQNTESSEMSSLVLSVVIVFSVVQLSAFSICDLFLSIALDLISWVSRLRLLWVNMKPALNFPRYRFQFVSTKNWFHFIQLKSKLITISTKH